MLDSRQKRAAVIGVARAWYRNPHPSGADAAQRASISQVYPVATFQDALPQEVEDSQPGSAGGRYYGAWAPDSAPHQTSVRRYEKTADDYELERLLKLASLKADRARQAEKIASRLSDNVTAVSDIHRAARSVRDNIQGMLQSQQITESTARERLQRLREDEDIILSLLIMDTI